MPALLLGSISTVADTSELQRSAFNDAFARHGLDWVWEREEYQQLLADSGGSARVEAYAKARGQQVEAGAVHETKSQIFQQRLASEPLTSRPGVVAAIAAAHAAGWQVGLVTTTARANVTALLAGLEDLSEADFDLITDVSAVERPKPDAAVYEFVVDELGEDAISCVAVEDNLGGIRAATDAGLVCLAFPNENTQDHDFGDVEVVERLDFEDIRTAAKDRR